MATRTHRHHRDTDRVERTPGGRMELVLIVDASGSMAGLESDTVGGVNAVIEENRSGEGEVLVSLVTFNIASHVLIDRQDIRTVAPLARKRYRCGGCTALLDAVGDAIRHIDLVQRVQPAGYAADRVLFVITTDGLENASRRYTYTRVHDLIERQRARGWEFVFIGAYIDVELEAERLGIDPGCAAPYVADEEGTEVLYRAAATAARAVREGVNLSCASWRDDLDRDARRRHGA